jgi:hypothetical protein
MRMHFPLIALVAAALLSATACGLAQNRESAKGGGATRSRAASGLTAEASAAPEGSRLEHDGVSIELPNGWQGRVVLLDYPSAELQAGNFEFVRAGVESPPGEEDPIKAMAAQHALVTILPCGMVSFEEPPRPAPEQVSLDDLTFLPRGHPRVPRGHDFAYGSFDFFGRCIRVEADFGGSTSGPKLKDAVNAVLGSLSVVDK